MKDDVHAVEHGGQVGVAQVQLMEGEVRVGAQAGQVAFLDRARVVGDEGVNAGDGVAGGDQQFAEMRADEAGSAG